MKTVKLAKNIIIGLTLFVDFISLFISNVDSLYYSLPTSAISVSLFLLYVLYCILALIFIKELKVSIIEICINGFFISSILVMCNSYVGIASILLFVFEIWFISAKSGKHESWIYHLFALAVFLELYSCIDLIFDFNFNGIINGVTGSIIADVIFIISVILLVYSLNKSKQNAFSEKLVRLNEYLALGIAYSAFIIATRVYVGYIKGESILHILVAIIIILLHYVVLYLFAELIGKDKSVDIKIFTSAMVLVVPAGLLSYLSLKAWMVSLLTLLIAYCLLRFVKSKKICYSLVAILFVIQTIVSTVIKIYTYPVVLLLICILIMRIDLKKGLGIILVCASVVLLAQVIFMNQRYYSKYKTYMQVYEVCNQIDEQHEYKINVATNDKELTKLLKKKQLKAKKSDGVLNPKAINIVSDSIDMNWVDHFYRIKVRNDFILFQADDISDSSREELSIDYVEDHPEVAVDVDYETNIAVVHVNNISKEHHDLSVAVWNSENDQDDLVWYLFEGQKDGSFIGKVDLSRHEGAGDMAFHIYGSYLDELECISEYVLMAN